MRTERVKALLSELIDGDWSEYMVEVVSYRAADERDTGYAIKRGRVEQISEDLQFEFRWEDSNVCSFSVGFQTVGQCGLHRVMGRL